MYWRANYNLTISFDDDIRCTPGSTWREMIVDVLHPTVHHGFLLSVEF
ncbi:hypothetical protein HMPREF1144_6065 [Klebsiella sp. OBRC7]|nr:hypothetical protein HMPREF1144_6065 [Klebsiella sp. OBRC7]